MDYDHKKIEKKWQGEWKKKKAFAAKDFEAKPKFYGLVEFPYPSGDGLHVGHVRSYTAMDVIARKRRMEGYNVLYPMGWDAFGLPTENYAIKTGVPPAVATKKNTENFKRQCEALGFSFDWDREIDTTDPEYYKWTQWIFLQLFKHGLAYKANMSINWCPNCKIGLANEEAAGGKCDRCGGPVEKRNKEQWMLKITAYADKLLEGLKEVDFLPEIKKQQENWIGRSEGAEFDFPLLLKDKPNFLILHGYTGRATKNFIPWLKTELEKAGYAVQAPELPNTKDPKEKEQVDYVMKNCTIDSNTIIVGHSLGAIVAMKVLELHKQPIQGLIMIAAAMNPDIPGANEKPFWKNFTWDVDYEALKRFARQRIILADLKEKQRISYLKDLAEKTDAEFITGYAEREHFCAEKEPILLRNILPQIKVFTTRPDTIFGATFIAVSPELAKKWMDGGWQAKPEVRKYIEQELKKSNERGGKDKTGMDAGIKAINPANKEEIPVWIVNYVLGDVGTGAIMAVPAHDERDFEFAKKYKLPMREVIVPDFGKLLPDEQYVEGVVVVGYDKVSNKFLGLRWKDKATWLVGGGKEKNESFEEAARRELAEETGYQNVSTLISLGSVYSHYYNDKKNINRRSFSVNFLAILDENEQGDANLEAHEDFIPDWYDGKTLREEIKKVGGGVEHWLEILDRAEEAISLYGEGKSYEMKPYPGNGILANSGKFSGIDSEKAKWEITNFVGGKRTVQYKLRDWVFSRQRYWGEPIPLIHCEKCDWVAVPEKDLPVELPKVKDYKPRDDGESPLSSVTKWVNVKCPKCKGPAKRETDVMPNWAGSSWYYLRYIDPKNKKALADRKKMEYWLGSEALRRKAPQVDTSGSAGGVNWYNGGMEHVTLHLLYSRFWNQFLYDIGVVPVKEPYKKRTAHGLILAEGGVKMSKSKGNVVNPDGLIKEFGADALRLYEMFIGPFDQAVVWDPHGIVGTSRFLERVWKISVTQTTSLHSQVFKDDVALEKLLNKTIKKVSEDIEAMSFNTSVSAMMILVNEFQARDKVGEEAWKKFLTILAPFAPHIAEELWSALGEKKSISEEPWPAWDKKMIEEDTFELVIQVNGKIRDKATVSKNISQTEAEKIALRSEKVKTIIGSNTPKKVIFVTGRLINIVL